MQAKIVSDTMKNGYSKKIYFLLIFKYVRFSKNDSEKKTLRNFYFSFQKLFGIVIQKAHAPY